jgi:putative transposase
MKSKSQPTNDFIGLDLGIKDFIVDSNGNSVENIKIKRNNHNKLAKLHKELSRKQKGSSNREKAKIKLAKFYEKLNNKKENYLHHITNQLIDENQVIVIEDLNVSGMLKNHHLAKSIQELSLYRFKEMLRYKANWYGNHIVEIDRFFPSSKLCSVCGNKNTKLRLKDREWICSECGTKHDRDFNAAINILNEGKRLYKDIIPTRCGELTPLETSGYAVDELGNRDLHNFV